MWRRGPAAPADSAAGAGGRAPSSASDCWALGTQRGAGCAGRGPAAEAGAPQRLGCCPFLPVCRLGLGEAVPWGAGELWGAAGLLAVKQASRPPGLRPAKLSPASPCLSWGAANELTGRRGHWPRGCELRRRQRPLPVAAAAAAPHPWWGAEQPRRALLCSPWAPRGTWAGVATPSGFSCLALESWSPSHCWGERGVAPARPCPPSALPCGGVREACSPESVSPPCPSRRKSERCFCGLRGGGRPGPGRGRLPQTRCADGEAGPWQGRS